jgi:hypothetical protein
MAGGHNETRRAVGNLALAQWAGAPEVLLRRWTYVAGAREREVLVDSAGVARVERTLPMVYSPAEEDGMLGHVAFALKHEAPHLGLLSVVFERLPGETVAAYVSAAPTGAYARRIGYLYELLTGRELRLPNASAIGGNYVPLLDAERMVTGPARRIPRWRVLDNLIGDSGYSPTIERTPAVQAVLSHDWAGAVREAAGGGYNPELLRRALHYLFRKETKSSFAIERERPSEERAARFISSLEQAGQLSVESALAEPALVQLQKAIVDPRYVTDGFRTDQNYVGGMVRWEPVIHYVSPPPGLLRECMAGLAAATARLAQAEPLAQAAVAAFGFVFQHPFADGNGRLHRFLIHDVLVRRGVVPGGMALPVSAAILEDMASYDRALEAYSGAVAKVVHYTLSDSGVLTVTNPKEAAWVWRYPDLTPQVEYLGRAMERAVQMVPEEVEFLARYDRLLQQAMEVVELPGARMSDLLACVHENGGRLSSNRRKQRFGELTEDEIARVEAAYQEIFGLPKPAASEK